MPKAIKTPQKTHSNATSTSTSVRRSSRLNKRKRTESTNESSITFTVKREPSVKRELSVPLVYASEESLGNIPDAEDRKYTTLSATSHDSCPMNSEKLLSMTPEKPLFVRRITPAELMRREKLLLRREAECNKKMDEIVRRQSEVDAAATRLAERDAMATLTQLEEYFTCPLCYEIIAHPYSLNAGRCGHSFCAQCLLKWFFSRLHKGCGNWHESVDCPICRQMVVITPDRVPRMDITFPFVPNRLGDTVCVALVEKLAQYSPRQIKREVSEGLPRVSAVLAVQCGASEAVSSSVDSLCATVNTDATQVQPKVEEHEHILDVQANLEGWREHGVLRADWLNREREGKLKMKHVAEHWTLFQAEDFVQIAYDLGV